jgi:riboflavin-specific deaminase-like protein
VARLQVTLLAMRLERLYPERRQVSADQAVSGLRLSEQASAERPYLVLNMVSTVDGKATIEGRTRELGNEADRELFHHLRTQVDAVMVGAGTVRVERYGRIVRDPDLREKRRREGLEPDPLAVIVSGRLDLPVDLPLLQDSDSRVLIATAATGELGATKARVGYARDEGGRVDLRRLLELLRVEHGVRSILCEGGPMLNAGLLRDGLVDELFLALAAKLTGGVGAPTIVTGGPLPEPVQLEPIWLLEGGGDLFLRYRILPSG